MRTVTFTVPGLATPWARAGRKGGFSYTPGKQRGAMADIKVLAQRAMAGAPLMAGPVMVRVTATYPWPASLSAKKRAAPNAHWKATRPDLSNLVKLVEDALIGVVYRDDGQIAGLAAYKTFDDAAELTVTIAELETQPSQAKAGDCGDTATLGAPRDDSASRPVGGLTALEADRQIASLDARPDLKTSERRWAALFSGQMFAEVSP